MNSPLFSVLSLAVVLGAIAWRLRAWQREQRARENLVAFALAKGFTEWASKSEIILFRREAGKEQVIKINYNDIVKGKLEKDILLKADDIIIVP